MVTVFLRTVFIFFVLIVSMRIMGKRQVGELQISELVVTFMLSELAVLPIADRAVPVSHALVPILTLLSAEVILSFLETKSNKLKKLLGGEPATLIRRGKLDADELARHRIELEELLAEMRLCGVFDIADAEYAILEENGRISVKPKADKVPATAADAGIAVAERGVARALIVDGELNEKTLRASGFGNEAIGDAIAESGTVQKSVFLMTADDGGNYTVYIKEEDGSVSSSAGRLKPGGCDI
ncbi:MAG: DUF421 domain-containing protein [Clostridia bacterium]|nr:DUF421 domain-containing protein [Clostridia bacterium]